MTAVILPINSGKLMKSKGYSILDGFPLVITILMNPHKQATSRDKNMVATSFADHSLADKIHALELSDYLISYQCLSKFQSILFSGRNLIDC